MKKPLKFKKKRFPYVSAIILLVLIAGCLVADLFIPKDPTYLDIYNCNQAPNGEFFFGTDSLGRDIFSCIWYGGRISIIIGLFSTLISTVIAVIYGSISGIAPEWLDTLMMRFTEIILSVPNLLVVLLLQAVLGQPTVVSLSVVIGVTGWPAIAKIIRTEVRQIRNSEYVIASRCMGGGFFHVLKEHLAPNFVAGIMFMVVMNIRSAIVAESTLSFMGMGLPLTVISWGSMLSLAEGALMSSAWWVILIPGLFLVLLIMTITNLGNWLRARLNPDESKI